MIGRVIHVNGDNLIECEKLLEYLSANKDKVAQSAKKYPVYMDWRDVRVVWMSSGQFNEWFNIFKLTVEYVRKYTSEKYVNQKA